MQVFSFRPEFEIVRLVCNLSSTSGSKLNHLSSLYQHVLYFGGYVSLGLQLICFTVIQYRISCVFACSFQDSIPTASLSFIIQSYMHIGYRFRIGVPQVDIYSPVIFACLPSHFHSLQLSPTPPSLWLESFLIMVHTLSLSDNWFWFLI